MGRVKRKLGERNAVRLEREWGQIERLTSIIMNVRRSDYGDAYR